LAPEDDHPCYWRSVAEERAGEIADLKQKLAALERRVLGPKSEKMPPMSGEVAKERPRDPEEAKRKRREALAAKASVETTTVDIPVPAEERQCPACGNQELKTVGEGTPSSIYDYVRGHFRKRLYRRETLSCSCGDYIVKAPPPDRVDDNCQYSASFIAFIIVSKCEDGLPFYRLAKMISRSGVPAARSTLTDLFHRGADLLAPLSARLIERVAEEQIVFADETSIKMLEGNKRAFIWTFLGGDLIGYEFSPDRSGETPSRVLGDSQGELVVDMYTGYNAITQPGKRRRAGCLAHARRKVFEAKEDPAAAAALEIIRDVYVVEHDARAAGIEGTSDHLELRRSRTRPLMARLLSWARDVRRTHNPKSPLGGAARYIARNHAALTRFTRVAALPPDNNRSEAALRRVALGRKNYLFVGNEDAGKNTAGLFSLVASCAHNEVDPIAYLSDVLVRVGSHPQSRIDELLPDKWRPPEATDR